jgi:hypothetical protein
VLRGLGLSDDEIHALEDAAIVGERPLGL